MATEMMTVEQMLELEALEKAATATGEGWQSVEMGDDAQVWSGPVEHGEGYAKALSPGTFTLCVFEPFNYNYDADLDEEECTDRAVADARLVAASRNALPALLAMAKAHLELVSALEFLSGKGWSADHANYVNRVLEPETLVCTALQLGWQSPTAKDSADV